MSLPAWLSPSILVTLSLRSCPHLSRPSCSLPFSNDPRYASVILLLHFSFNFKLKFTAIFFLLDLCHINYKMIYNHHSFEIGQFNHYSDFVTWASPSSPPTPPSPPSSSWSSPGMPRRNLRGSVRQLRGVWHQRPVLHHQPPPHL